jgi:hypothetical protein
VVIGAEGPISIDSHSLHYYSDGAAGGRKEGRLHYFSTLKIEVTYFSEMSIGFQQTTRRHIPEDISLHNQRCENLKSNKGDDGFIISNEIISIIVKNTILSDKKK